MSAVSPHEIPYLAMRSHSPENSMIQVRCQDRANRMG
jgi:hypothetical protein